MRTILILAAVCCLAACNKPAQPPPTPTPVSTTPVSTGGVNPPVTVMTYYCADGQTVTAGYPTPDTAVVTWQDHAYTLKVARSASGARYTGFGLQWWTKGMSEGTLAPLKAGEEVASAPGVLCTTTPAPAVAAPLPGTPGGLADDRTPISETKADPKSAQAAADVVQVYYALIGEKKYGQAWDMWPGAATDRTSFIRGFEKYASYNAQVGAPGDTEGGAGSIYVEVPVVIYGRLKSGAEVQGDGKVTLRRVNDVDGSTAAQRRWHIMQIDLKTSA